MRHPNQKVMEDLLVYTKRYDLKYGHATGAFIVKKDKIIGKAVTTVEKDNDPTSHAELKAISKACRSLKKDTLRNCYIYTTQEPCPMCAGAMVWAEIKGVVYGREGRQSWGKLNMKPEIIFKKSQNKIRLHKKFMEKECLDLKKQSMNQ